MKRDAFSPKWYGLVVTVVFTLANVAQAQTLPLKSHADGQIIEQVDPTPENPVGVQVYVTEGTSTLAGATTGIGITYFTLDGLVSGAFVGTASDGSTIEGEYTGTFAPIPGTPNFVFEVSTVWYDGTERFAGVTGESEAVAIVDGLTGAFEVEHQGFWLLP